MLKAKSAKKVYIQNSRFVENVALAQIFYFQSSQDVTIKDCIFKDNKAQQITPGFNLQSSTLKMTNITISQQPTSNLAKRVLQASAAVGTLGVNPKFSSQKTLDLDQSTGDNVIAGFFMASSSSDLQFQEGSISGTQGSVASAFYI